MSTKKAAIENAEQVIERFGGIRPMSSKINVPVTTIQGWKKRNVIPGTRRADIENAAAALKIDISDLMVGVSSTAPQAPAPVTAKSSVANENGQKQKKKTASKPASKENASLKEAAPAPLAAKPAPVAASSNDALLKSIEAGNRKTVVTTVWVVTALILLGIALTSFFYGPALMS